MVNYDKLKDRAKELGIKLSFLCDKIGVYPTYIADSKNKNLDIPNERLTMIADLLNTTIEYLRDETDIKEKQSSSPSEDISEERKELHSLIDRLPPERRQEAAEILKSLIKHSGQK